MTKRPNFRTVNDASVSMPQPFDPHRERHFQPSFSLNDRLKRHPMVFWGIIWGSIALPSALAIGSLINPNSGEPQIRVAIAQKSGSTKAAQFLPKPVQDSGQLPLWVFGAIAVSCTTSCFILAQYIKPIEGETSEVSVEVSSEADAEVGAEELSVTNQPALETRSQRQIHASKQPLKRLKPYEPTEALPFMQRELGRAERSEPIQPLAVEWVTPTKQFLDSPYFPATDLAEPVLVTVIPVEETQPLDWGEARLADTMDLRRRYPLHWVANNNSQS